MMPALDLPTAADLWEQRTWRVVTLCCESTEPDWHGEGSRVPPGGQVLVRLQGYRDGRCGWTGGSEVRVAIDGVPTTVASGFPAAGYANWTLGAVGPGSLWLARVPERMPPGPHNLAIRYRTCTWSGTIEVGTPAPTPPPAPTLSADFQWVHLPDYGGALWWAGKPYDLSLEHWLHLPYHEQRYAPAVLCAIDAQGRAHGAWEVHDTEGADYMVVKSELVQIDYPPCDALK